MAINDMDHDVEELVMDDFPDEALETTQYMISQAELSKTGKRFWSSRHREAC